MSWVERVLISVVGLTLFVVAAALVVRTAILVPSVFTASGDLLAQATNVLNNVLLVLMLIELASTVMLSLHGIVLSAEPFLIVGLIATVRRILVITIGEPARGPSHTGELMVLIALLLAFVASIFTLGLRARVRARLNPGSVRGPVVKGAPLEGA